MTIFPLDPMPVIELVGAGILKARGVDRVAYAAAVAEAPVMKRIPATVTLLSEMTGFADLDAWLTRPPSRAHSALPIARDASPPGARLCASREQAAEAPKSDGRL